MFTPGWKSLVRDGSYKLDKEQMDNLRRYIENHYLKKALQSHVIDLTSTDSEDNASNFLTNTTINGQQSNGVHPTPSLPSLNNALDDLSFLGPGQMPQPFDSFQFSIDLSMLGPGEINTTFSQMPSPKGGRAALTENNRDQASLLWNRRSHTPEKPNKKLPQTKQEESEEESSPDSTERKRLLSTWLSPSKKLFGSVVTSARKPSTSSANYIQRASESSPSTANHPQNPLGNPESKLSSPLTKVETKVETENGADSGSAQQWVSSLFMKSDPKPSSKGRRSVKKEPSRALASGRRRGPYRKSGRLVQQGNLLL